MILKYCLFLIFHVVYAKIEIKLHVDDGNISINYSGIDVRVINDKDVELFKIGTSELTEALAKHYGREPSYHYLKSPTPWGDLYKTYGWEEITHVLSVNSVRVIGVKKESVILKRKHFINKTNDTVTVDASVSDTVENTITTDWTKEKEMTMTQDLEYGLFFVTGNTGFSYTSKWGKSETKSETVTIGSTSRIETKLQPGKGLTAVLEVTTGFIEVEVVYKMSLRGNVAVNFRRKHKGHHFWAPKIEDVMKSGGISNEILSLETIKYNYYSDSTVKVYDKTSED